MKFPRREREENKTTHIIINFLKLKDYEKAFMDICSSSRSARSMQQ